MTTNLEPDFKIDLTLTTFNVWTDEALNSALQPALSVLSMPSKNPVQGKLDARLEWRKGSFVPSALLAANTDYLVRIQKTPVVEPEREYSLIRIGSLPRVKQISFIANGNDLASIVVLFSEDVDRAKAAAATTVKLAATGAAVPAKLSTAGVSSAFTLDVASGIKLTDKLTISIGTDVGAPTGTKLDGKYTGMADSGDLTVDVTPTDFTTKHWEPPLNF